MIKEDRISVKQWKDRKDNSVYITYTLENSKLFVSLNYTEDFLGNIFNGKWCISDDLNNGHFFDLQTFDKSVDMRTDSGIKKKFLNDMSLLLQLLNNDGVVGVFVSINSKLNIKKFLKDNNSTFASLNFDNFEKLNWRVVQAELQDNFNLLLSKLELVEYGFCSIEISKNGDIHYHYLIGIRSVVGFNISLIEQIKGFFFQQKTHSVWVDILWFFKNINNVLHYIFKKNYCFIGLNEHEINNLTKIPSLFYFGVFELNSLYFWACANFQEPAFVDRNSPEGIIVEIIEFYTHFFDTTEIIISLNWGSLMDRIKCPHYFSAFNNFNELKAKNLNYYNWRISSLFTPSVLLEISLCCLKTMKIIEKRITEDIIINLWGIFLILNNIFIYNDKLYKRSTNTFISYFFWGDLNYLYESFDEIINFFFNTFPGQTRSFDFYNLKLKYLHLCRGRLKDLGLLFGRQIELNFNFMEFKDGIYDLQSNKFFKKSKFNIFQEFTNFKKIATIKYYNKSFKHLKLPTAWLNNLNEVIVDTTKLDLIFFFFANLFSKNNEFFKKKKVLYISGATNTYKTTLIAKPIINYFGYDNIGLVTTSQNFYFQELINKKIGLFDEFEYKSKYKKELLKLFEGQFFKVDIKFKAPESLNDLYIIIISNEEISENNESNIEILKALKSRLNEVTFSNFNLNTTNNKNQIDILIRQEEAEIIVYCNKQYFSNFLKKL